MSDSGRTRVGLTSEHVFSLDWDDKDTVLLKKNNYK